MSLEKDVQLGQVGDLDIKLSGGKASLTLHVAVPQAALTVGASVEMDAAALIDKLKAAIEAKSSPNAVAIEEGIFNLLKTAVSAL